MICDVINMVTLNNILICTNFKFLSEHLYIVKSYHVDDITNHLLLSIPNKGVILVSIPLIDPEILAPIGN